jgi:hypothetical protein
MSELEREMQEAAQAQAEAEAAMRRAEEARAEAEAMRLRFEEEQERNQLAWAQSVADAYDADLAAAEAAIRDASDRFAAAATRDLSGAVAAYLAWAEASLRHYTLQVRVATVAPLLDLEATPGERLTPPPFSQALDAAIAHHVSELSERIRDETAAEIGSRLDTTIAAPEAAR